MKTDVTLTFLRPNLGAFSYRRWEANVSDHRPISAGKFKITVKSVRPEARARVKAEAKAMWKGVETRLLCEAMQYYIDQQMI